MEYKDFDCLIDPHQEGYKIRILDSPVGRAEGIVQLPFDERDLENMILKMSLVRGNLRGIESAEMKVAREFGGKLFQAFFNGEMDKCLQRSLDEIDHLSEVEDKEYGLRLKLRFTDTPALLHLPWEYLYYPPRNNYFCLASDISLTRYLDTPHRKRLLKVDPPLRVLVMISAPVDWPRLDSKQEQENLKNALMFLKRRRRIEIDFLKAATLAELREQLRRKEYHIFHYIGHGGFDLRTNASKIIFEDEDHNSHEVSGEQFAHELQNEKSLRLVVLNSCEGARTSRQEPFAGTAQQIVQHGIPAVVAMQFAITDKAAIAFAKNFYKELARGHSLDTALTQTRQALKGQSSNHEWAAPVLYMSTPDGRLFDINKKDGNEFDDENEQDEIFRSHLEMQILLSVLHQLHECPQDARGLSIAELMRTLNLKSQHRGVLVDTLYEQLKAGSMEQIHVQGNTFWKLSDAGRKMVSRLQESFATRERAQANGG